MAKGGDALAGVERGGLAPLLRGEPELEDLELPTAAPERVYEATCDGRGAVGAVVRDHDDLHRPGVALAQQRAKARAEDLGLVPGRDDDREWFERRHVDPTPTDRGFLRAPGGASWFSRRGRAGARP